MNTDEGFEGQIGNAFEHWPSGGVGFDEQHSVLIKFARTDSLGTILDDPAGTVASYGYRYLLHADRPPVRPEFAAYMKNTNSAFAYQDYTLTVPFSAYDIDVSPPERLVRAPWPARVTLTVYNMLGQRVRTLADHTPYAGAFAVKWDGTNRRGSRMASGVYFYRLEAQPTVASGESFVQTKKMLLL